MTEKYKNVPSSLNTVREIVLKYGEKNRKEVIENITKHKITKKAVSLTFDEWTAINNRRYMNINIHTANHFWNIGLTRVSGHLPAENVLLYWKRKLKISAFLLKMLLLLTRMGRQL